MNNLRSRQLIRDSDKLRLEFITYGLEEIMGPYFDTNIVTARHLPSMSNGDLLLLLRIGISQNIPLIITIEYQTCLKRGYWYGRRLWLQEQLAMGSQPTNK